MIEQAKCFLCGNPRVTSQFGDGSLTIYNCDVCGKIPFSHEFYISYCHQPDYQLELFDGNGQSLSYKDNEKAKASLRYYYKKSDIDGKKPEALLTTNMQDIINLCPSPVNMSEKMDLILDYINEKTVDLFEKIEINARSDYPLFFCHNEGEMRNILEALKKEEILQVEGNSILDAVADVPVPYTHKVNLTYKGIKYLEDKEIHRMNSKQCFVAMWFDKEMEEIYTNYIKPAIEETDAKFKAKKINDVHHNNDINDQIITEIRRSRFMVVDLTGYRGGVYFEAGFGFGLGIPVIYTCKKNWLEKEHDKEGHLQHEGVHFDVNHRNILVWTDDKTDTDYEKLNLNEFKKNLTARINAIIV